MSDTNNDWASRRIFELESRLAAATDLLQTADEPYDMAAWRRRRDAFLATAPAAKESDNG